MANAHLVVQSLANALGKCQLVVDRFKRGNKATFSPPKNRENMRVRKNYQGQNTPLPQLLPSPASPRPEGGPERLSKAAGRWGFIQLFSGGSNEFILPRQNIKQLLGKQMLGFGFRGREEGRPWAGEGKIQVPLQVAPRTFSGSAQPESLSR